MDSTRRVARRARRFWDFVAGTPGDWHLRRPTRGWWRPPALPGWHLVGPLAVVASLAASWPAFAGATGEDGGGTVALGLWVGAVSILLMAWSFILAFRPRLLEPLFGGLDRMYRVHRWAGALAVVFMFLHTSVEPEIEGGVLGAGRGVANAAEDLAGVGEVLLYGLVGLSLVRLFPYRWWRWTHKLLGVPFLFACAHFVTAEKPYANGSAWGWWFGIWMAAGTVAYLGRVVGRDTVAPGVPHRVVAAEHPGPTTRLELEPLGKPLGHRVGQFAFVKLGVPGLAEPHPFTIASSPERRNLTFHIGHLGDWSERLATIDLVGRTARVEGPYGRFEPLGRAGQPALWIAGGVGITPFLAALDRPRPAGQPAPTLLYAVRSATGDPIVERLRGAEARGEVTLELFTPSTGRLGPADLDRLFPDGLAGHHVALCGPAGLVATMSAAARQRGARHTETEDFDLRQGFGPERSSALAAAWRRLTAGGYRGLLAQLQQRLLDPADVVAAPGGDGVGDQRRQLVEG